MEGDRIAAIGKAMELIRGGLLDEFIIETLNGVVKENEELRALCEEYRGAIEKLRAKVVEQDSVIGKLAVGNGKVPLC